MVDFLGTNVNATTVADNPDLPSLGTYNSPLTQPEEIKAEQRSSTLGEHMLMAVPGVVAGALDTFGRSVSFGYVSDDAMQNFLKSAAPDFGDYYTNNKSALRTTGELATFLIPGSLGIKAITSGSRLARGLESATGLASDSKLMRSVFATAGGEAAIAEKVARADLASSATRSLEFTMKDPVRAQVVSEAFKTGAADSIKKYVASEVATYMTMNQSEVLYPSDMSLTSQLAFHAVGAGAFIGVDALFLRSAIKKSLLSPEIQENIKKSINSLDVMLDGGSAFNRDYAMTTWAMTSAEQRATTASKIGDGVGDVALRSNANKYANLADEQVRNAAEQALGDKLPWMASTQKSNPAALESITTALKNNPTAAVGVSAIEAMPQTTEDLLSRVTAHQTFMVDSQTRVDELNERINKMVAKANKLEKKGTPLEGFAEQQWSNKLFTYQTEIQKLSTQMKQFDGLTPVVMEASGEVVPASKRGLQYHDMTDAPGIQYVPGSANVASEYRLAVNHPTTGNRTTAALNKDLVIQTPNSKDWDKLDRFEHSMMYAMGQKFVDSYKPGRMATDKIALDENSSPLALDIAATIIKKNPEAIADFNIPAHALADAENWINQQALTAKYEKIFVPMMDKYVAQFGSGHIVPTAEQITKLEDIRYALNIGTAKEGTQSPLFQVMQSFYFQGDRKLADALGNFKDLQGMMKEAMLPLGGAKAADLQPEIVDFMRSGDIPVMGTNLAVPTSKSGGFLPAQLAWVRSEPFDITQQGMLKYAVATKMEKLDMLTNAPGLVGQISKDVSSNAAYQYAKQVDTLAEGMQMSTGSLTYQNMTTRGLPVFTALDMLSNLAEKNSQKAMKDIFDKHADTFMALRANKDDMFQFAQFAQARRAGFDLAENAEKMQDGSYAFPLRTVLGKDGEPILTKKNLQALERMGMETKDLGVYANGSEQMYLMPMATPEGYKPLMVGENAMKGVNAISDIYGQLWEGSNFFRKYYGASELGRQNFYVPPENLSAKFIKYVVSPAENGTGAVKQLVTGNTLADVNNKLKQVIDLMPNPERVQVIDQNTMKQFFHLHDEAFFNMVNMSDGLRQTGKMGGNLYQRQTEYGVQVLNDMVKAAENMVTMQARRTLGVMYEDQINYARMAHSSIQEKGGADAPSIYKQYVARALGVNPASYQGGAAEGEQLLDKMLTTLANKTKNLFGKSAEQLGKLREKDYAELKEALGDKLPYDDAVEFAKNTFKVEPPTDLHKWGSALNSTAVNLQLRIGETANGIMAVLGNLVTMPLVMNLMKRQKYDTDETFLARTGLFGADIGHPDIAMPNPARMMSKAVSQMFTKEGQAIINEARALGNINSHVAEAAIQLHKPFETYTEKSVRNFVNWASITSDVPEAFSRSWAYLAGYMIAKDGYHMTNARDMHAVANLFAENVIANYRSVNKPGIFTGFTGSALGMFQSYMYNYWGRMFQYVENKDWRGLATNYAMQGSVFGMRSVPGWEQFQSMYGWAYSQDKDIVDSLDSKYGRHVTDLLLNGTISNIPRIFGSDSIALYSRGDANLTRVPAFIDPTNAPLFNLAKNTGNLVGALVGQFKSGGIPSTQNTLEAMGTYTLNRPLSRVFELAAGTSVDQRGNLINADTRTPMSVAARMMGLRPFIESKAIETNARIATSEAANTEMHNRLSDGLRALLRDNPTPQQLDAAIANASMDYLKAGGSPTGIAAFIRNSMYHAMMTKQEAKLKELLNNPSRTNDVMRLITNMTAYQQD